MVDETIVYSIKSACEALVAEGRPVTRKEIAKLANCHVRTVSKYNSVWKNYAVTESTTNPRYRTDVEVFDQRHAMLMCRLDDMDEAELRSLLTTLNWYESYFGDVRRAVISEARERILCYLNK